MEKEKVNLNIQNSINLIKSNLDGINDITCTLINTINNRIGEVESGDNADDEDVEIIDKVQNLSMLRQFDNIMKILAANEYNLDYIADDLRILYDTNVCRHTPKDIKTEDVKKLDEKIPMLVDKLVTINVMLFKQFKLLENINNWFYTFFGPNDDFDIDVENKHSQILTVKEPTDILTNISSKNFKENIGEILHNTHILYDSVVMLNKRLNSELSETPVIDVQ